MKLSDVHSAKGLKIKLQYEDESMVFIKDALLQIDATKKEREFFAQQYGTQQQANKSVLVKTDAESAGYLMDLFEGEKQKAFKCIFSIEGVGDNHIELQAYTFGTMTEYKIPIYIQVPSTILKNITPEKLQGKFLWNQLGNPALFCLNYKSKKKQKDNIRFVSGKQCLHVKHTPRGMVIEKLAYFKDGYNVPTDIHIASEIKFVEETDAILENEEFSEEINKISTSASYLARWDAYSTLNEKLLKKEKEEFGEITYTGYDVKPDLTGVKYTFFVKDEFDETYIDKELCVKGSNETDQKQEEQHPIPVGAVKRVTKKYLVTYMESADISSVLPTKGVLELLQMGDASIIARRNRARERMTKHRTPIKALDALIELGATQVELPGVWGSHKAVTEKLKRNFKKADSLNERQREAIKIAINTPDIALIQGPPGTGKTTVIKAICERFREIYEENERSVMAENDEYQIQSPKILLSSFQNEAVDNAISTPLPGDIPAYRKMARRSKNSSHEQYHRALEKWYMDLKSGVAREIGNKTASEYVEVRSSLEDEYISYKNSGEDLGKAVDIIKRYLAYTEIKYPENVVSDANEIIRVANDGDDSDAPDPLIAKLESQRLDETAFKDDGQRNAKRLAAHLKIREDLKVSDDVIKIIDTIGDGDYTKKEFSKYLHTIKVLKSKYIKQKVTLDKAFINKCILNMDKNFNMQYINLLSDNEAKKSLILSEFLSRLDHEYESIVRKYSMTTAATCQASLDLGRLNKTFDLVIIDEAARANPLDLFIPMSMGKKIILVGDHKQLPHMLEPDVLKQLLDDPLFKDLDEIEKSLFERMFNMFLKGNNPKAVLLTDQYRMHPEICRFVSTEFYDGKLETSPNITPELRSSPAEINGGRALTLVNIPIEMGAETQGFSKSRMAEVEVLCKDIRSILKTGKDTTIGVITFYELQALKIKDELDLLLNEDEKRQVEVGTVDAFQGKEFDYVMLSCVRSNYPKKDGGQRIVGFLEKPNRLCVAFSRAMRQLIVYCDIETLRGIPCFEHLYRICAIENGGCYREY